MDTIIINGVTFNDLGFNNYTNGMHLISCYPIPENIIADVLNGKYPEVYLNPSAPCNSEFFAVKGTEEQYREFYSRQKDAQISKLVLELLNYNFSASPEEWKNAQAKAEASYKDWWE